MSHQILNRRQLYLIGRGVNIESCICREQLNNIISREFAWYDAMILERRTRLNDLLSYR